MEASCRIMYMLTVHLCKEADKGECNGQKAICQFHRKHLIVVTLWGRNF